MFSDTFDSESQGLNVASLTNWSITGSVDVLGSTVGNFYPGNGNYLDMDGSTPTGANGTIVSPHLTLSPGTYQLSFEIGNNPDGVDNNLLQVTLGDLFDEIFTPTALLTPTTNTIVVTTSATESLVFQEKGDDNCGGAVIDDVVLTLLSVT